MSTHSKISVLIPDGESHILSYIVNCFAKSGGVDLFVMSNNKNNYMRFSRHIKRFLHHNKKEEIDWIKQIDEYVETFNIDVVLPIYEKGIRVLIKNKKVLKHSHKLCTLPSLKNFDAACNKELLDKHLQSTTLLYPKSVISSYREYPNLKSLQFPIIAKPVEGSGGGVGIKILKNETDVKQYCETTSFKCNIIYQEYIKGYDICTNVLCEKGEILAHTTQKGVAFENGEVTYQVIFEFLEDEALIESTEALMKSLNWNGPANIDWRYDEVEKQFKVIEINPRFWYNTDASATAGVNFPYLSCLNFVGKTEKPAKVKFITYYNLKGLVKKIKQNPLVLFNVSFLKNQTPLFFALTDPVPIIHKFLWRSKNIILRR